MIPLAEPEIGALEKQRLLECLDSGFVSSVGPMIPAFESRFAEHLGVPHAVAVASGTAALHLALRVLGVGRGDRIAVPDLTFVATVNAVLYLEAEPVLIDVDPRSMCMDVELLRAVCLRAREEGRPLKACIPVHLYGGSPDMDALLDVAREYDLRVVEDATEALGGSWRGRPLGTFGDCGCFSFNGNKMITTGAGGMVLSREPTTAEAVRHLATQARVNDDYSHDAMGYNYRMSNLHAALGLAQLEKLDRFVQAKRQVAGQYQQALAAVPGVTCHPTLPGCQNAYWLYSILVPPGADASDWIKSLQRCDIGARSFFKPLHRQAYLDRPVWTWQDRHVGPAWTGCADQLFQRGINLPSSVTLRREEQQLVIDAVQARGRNEKPCCQPNVSIA